MNSQLEVSDVVIAYDRKPVVNQVSFQLGQGEIGCLLGPSGCGKTTLLRAIAGFEPLQAGEILLHGQQISRSGYMLAPEKRRIGMVFQDFALYPHLSVEQNVGFGLRGMPRFQRKQRIDELLRLVDLEPARRQYPHQLSGGQQQRVALIRAMAPHPEILLLDEPFSSLDVELRDQLAREVREILKRDGITAVLVTHDQLEAFSMADTIGVLAEGELRQWAGSYELYHKPADRFVADFIGQGAMLPGRVIDHECIDTGLGRLKGRMSAGFSAGTSVRLLLRPDDIIHDDDSPLKLKVVDRVFQGAAYLYTLQLPDGNRVFSLVQSHHDHRIGESIGVRPETGHLVVFPAEPG